MSEPKTYAESRFNENVEAMRTLASGGRGVVIRAHWPDPSADMNQVLFYHDPEAEINFYRSLYNRMVDGLEAGFDNLPFFRVDFGRMAWLMSVAYGCEVIEVGKLLNTKPRFSSLEPIADFSPPGPVHEHGFYPEITKRMQEIERRFGPVPFVPSDTQSPIDVATEVVATEPFLLGLYDSPDLVHKLLEMLAASIGDILEYQASIVTNWIGYGHDYPLPVGVHLSDDNAAFLSPEVYEEFAAPTIETLGDRFGGVTLHCCMGYQQNLAVMSGVRGFLGFDPQPGYNEREKILSAVRDRGFWRIFNVPEGSDPLSVYKEAIDQTDGRAGLMLDVHAGDRDASLRLASEVHEYAAKKGRR
jgi:hypothetical protein